MKSALFHTLSPTEREDLALCGISTEEQFARVSVSQLCKDLRQARQFFPERTFTLTEDKIKALCPETKETEVEKEYDFHPTGRSSLPTTGFRERSKNAGKSKRKANKKNKHHAQLHSPVRCTHRFTAITAAICTLFLLIPLASVVVLPYLMITDQMPDISIELLASIVLLIPCAVYMFVARRATCPVCHMRIFRYSHYIRNKAAHHLPILGYNFATALHLLFFLNYNCPGCGTPIKLLGSKGHRTHC